MSLFQTVRNAAFATLLVLGTAAAQAATQGGDPASTSPGLGSLRLWTWLISMF